MEKGKLFLLIGVFWILIILTFVGYKEFTLQTGDEVLLKTAPVDPRDLFRGDYVILSYQIGNLDLPSLTSNNEEFENGDKFYLSLDVEDGYATASKIHKNPPKQGLFIRGTVMSVSRGRLRAEYGIESYFVPEDEGRIIERRSGLDVKVAIDNFGNAVIKSLILDDKEVSFD
jgi:uncharacterized membrane-anchored protein